MIIELHGDRIEGELVPISKIFVLQTSDGLRAFWRQDINILKEDDFSKPYDNEFRQLIINAVGNTDENKLAELLTAEHLDKVSDKQCLAACKHIYTNIALRPYLGRLIDYIEAKQTNDLAETDKKQFLEHKALYLYSTNDFSGCLAINQHLQELYPTNKRSRLIDKLNRRIAEQNKTEQTHITPFKDDFNIKIKVAITNKDLETINGLLTPENLDKLSLAVCIAVANKMSPNRLFDQGKIILDYLNEHRKEDIEQAGENILVKYNNFKAVTCEFFEQWEQAIEAYTFLNSIAPTDFKEQRIQQLHEKINKRDNPDKTKNPSSFDEERITALINKIRTNFEDKQHFGAFLYSLNVTSNYIQHPEHLAKFEAVIRHQWSLLENSELPNGVLCRKILAKLELIPSLNDVYQAFTASTILPLEQKLCEFFSTTTVPTNQSTTEQLIELLTNHIGDTVLSDSTQAKFEEFLKPIFDSYLAGKRTWSEMDIYKVLDKLQRFDLHDIVLNLTEPLVTQLLGNQFFVDDIFYIRVISIIGRGVRDTETPLSVWETAQNEYIKASTPAEGVFVTRRKAAGSKLRQIRAQAQDWSIKQEKLQRQNLVTENIVLYLADDYMRPADFADILSKIKIGTGSFTAAFDNTDQSIELLKKGGLDMADAIMRMFRVKPYGREKLEQLVAKWISAVSNPDIESLLHLMAAELSIDKSKRLYHATNGLNNASEQVAVRLQAIIDHERSRSGRYYTRQQRFAKLFRKAVSTIRVGKGRLLPWTATMLSCHNFWGCGRQLDEIDNSFINDWLNQNSEPRGRLRLTQICLLILQSITSSNQNYVFNQIVLSLNKYFKGKLTNPNIVPDFGMLNIIAENLGILSGTSIKRTLLLRGIEIILGNGWSTDAEPISEEKRNQLAFWLMRCISNAGIPAFRNIQWLSDSFVPVTAKLFSQQQWDSYTASYDRLQKLFDYNGPLRSINKSADIHNALNILSNAFGKEVNLPDQQRIMQILKRLSDIEISDTPGCKIRSRMALEEACGNMLKSLVSEPLIYGAEQLILFANSALNILDNEMNSIDITAPIPNVEVIEFTNNGNIILKISLPRAETYPAIINSVEIPDCQATLDTRLYPADSIIVELKTKSPVPSADITLKIIYSVKETSEEQLIVTHTLTATSIDTSTPLPNLYRQIDTSISNNPEMFYGRKELLAKILSNIDSGNTCLYYGQRRSGKTSVLMKIAHMLKSSETPTAFIDLSAMGAYISLRSFYMIISNSIADALGHPADFPYYKQFKDYAAEFDDESMSPFFFRKTVSEWFDSHPSAPRVVVMLDEFSTVFGAIAADIAAGHQRKLTTILTTWKNALTGLPVRFVISSQNDTPAFLDIFRHEIGDFLMVVNVERLSFFNEAEAEEFIIKPLSGKTIFMPEAIQSIKELSGMNPYYMMKVLTEIIDNLNTNHSRTVTLNVVDNVCRIILNNPNMYYKNMYDSTMLTGFPSIADTVQQTLNRFAEVSLKENSAEISPEHIYATPTEEQQEALRQLIERKVFTTTNNGNLRLQVGLFANHLRAKAKELASQRKTSTYQRSTTRRRTLLAPQESTSTSTSITLSNNDNNQS